MVKNIAVIGDSESIKGFGAVGIDMFICDEPLESGNLFKRIAETDDYAIIYMTEELFELSAKERHKFADNAIPSVIPIPSAKGNRGIGQKRLSKFVEQAVGSDILFGN